MELTIVLSVRSESEDYDILDTLESLPWDQDGVDLLVYSEDTGRIKKVIDGDEDLKSTIQGSGVGVVFCETSLLDHHTLGLEDTKTEGVMFLEAGDIIEDFQSDLLITGLQEPLGIPGIGSDGVPETIACYELRSLPENYRGIVFKAQWLRENGVTDIYLGMMAKVCDLLEDKLSGQEYWGGWSDLDISESLSITRVQDEDTRTINSYINLWEENQFSHSSYLRDLVWTRIMTSAARIVSSGDEYASNFQVYLYPASKLTVLS